MLFVIAIKIASGYSNSKQWNFISNDKVKRVYCEFSPFAIPHHKWKTWNRNIQEQPKFSLGLASVKCVLLSI